MSSDNIFPNPCTYCTKIYRTRSCLLPYQVVQLIRFNPFIYEDPILLAKYHGDFGNSNLEAARSYSVALENSGLHANFDKGLISGFHRPVSHQSSMVSYPTTTYDDFQNPHLTYQNSDLYVDQPGPQLSTETSEDSSHHGGVSVDPEEQLITADDLCQDE